MTRRELLDLPVVIDLPTAARALGIGRTKAHELAKAGCYPEPDGFPCRLIKVGGAYKVPVVGVGGLLDVLGVPVDRAAPKAADAA